jgi:hypothetical protein
MMVIVFPLSLIYPEQLAFSCLFVLTEIAVVVAAVMLTASMPTDPATLSKKSENE